VYPVDWSTGRPAFWINSRKQRCCFESHLPLHFVPDTKDFVFDTKYTKNTMSNPEHDHGASQPGGTDTGPTTPPITKSQGDNSQTATCYVPPSTEQ
jgi:hypothetical protein